MVAEDRGVTEANYVDVMSLTSLPPALLTASLAGRKMFRAASGGGDTVTSLQLARLAHPGIMRLPGPMLRTKAKFSQADLVEAATQYMGSQLPDIDLSVDQSVLSSLAQSSMWLLLVFSQDIRDLQFASIN